MHTLLDSDVHFAAVLGRLNSRSEEVSVDCQMASDAIYLLSQSFHSAWYETLDGQVSMFRRRDAPTFRARYEDVVRATALLQGATISQCCFRNALLMVRPGDLVFLDPPYLYGPDRSDQQAYTAERFTTEDLRVLAAEMRRLVSAGASVIFCWGERAEAIVPRDGSWRAVGRDYVWFSKQLSAALVPAIDSRQASGEASLDGRLSDPKETGCA